MARGPTVVRLPPRIPLRTRGRNNDPIPDLANVLIALRTEPGFSVAFAFDEMQHEVILRANPPLAPNTEPGGSTFPRFVNEEDITRIQEWMQLIMPKVGREHIHNAVEVFAREQPVHPLRDWLRSLEDVRTKSDWALRGPVLENWLSYALGVPDDAYHREVGRRFIISMVARVMEPGCQCDYMLVLEGPQGELKSQFCRKLAGDRYFSDHMPDLRGDLVRVSMALKGKWLHEFAELAAFNRISDVENLKALITRQEEIYVPKYGRKERREPRQCVFVGTTNEDEWIKDATGGRRFWPVRVTYVDLDWLAEHRDQLFCEAVEAYDADEPWWPDRTFERRVIRPHQERRQVHEEWTDRVLDIAKSLTVVAIDKIWDGLASVTRGGDLANLDMNKSKRIAAILKKAGYERATGGDGRKIWRKSE